MCEKQARMHGTPPCDKLRAPVLGTGGQINIGRS